jgi:hypothetical protein
MARVARNHLTFPEDLQLHVHLTRAGELARDWAMLAAWVAGWALFLAAIGLPAAR